jgi:hypothetical protein
MGTNKRRPRPRRPKHAEPVDLDERKERVLHTRVPESLDRHIKSRAKGQGLSVSTVVRNVLLNTFGLVEDIVTDSTNIALAIAGEDTAALGRGRHARARADEEPAAGGIVAWQESVLNVNAVCADCNAVLRKGTRAAIAVRERPGPRAILCRRCLGKIGGTTTVSKSRERRKTS